MLLGLLSGLCCWFVLLGWINDLDALLCWEGWVMTGAAGASGVNAGLEPDGFYFDWQYAGLS